MHSSSSSNLPYIKPTGLQNAKVNVITTITHASKKNSYSAQWRSMLQFHGFHEIKTWHTDLISVGRSVESFALYYPVIIPEMSTTFGSLCVLDSAPRIHAHWLCARREQHSFMQEIDMSQDMHKDRKKQQQQQQR